MALINPTLPTVGQDRGTEEADVLSVLTALLAEFNGSIDNANIKSTAGILASKLETNARPAALLIPYHAIAHASLALGNGDTAGVYLPTLGACLKSGNNNAVVANTPFTLVYLTGADYAVAGLTTRLRVVAATAVNGTAPGVNFTFGLYPVTVSGASTNQILTAGTVVPGSTVTRTAPSASTAYQDASADFAAPANGVYALGVNVSGTTAANSELSFTLRLEAHCV